MQITYTKKIRLAESVSIDLSQIIKISIAQGLLGAQLIMGSQAKNIKMRKSIFL